MQTITKFPVYFSKVFQQNCRMFTKNLRCEKNLDNAIRKLKCEEKPGLVIITRNWCPACTDFKKLVLNSPYIANISKKFVCIHLSDDNDPKKAGYAPDGDYVPRVLFLNSAGAVLPGIRNPKCDKTKYYYRDLDNLLQNMQTVLDAHAGIRQ